MPKDDLTKNEQAQYTKLWKRLQSQVASGKDEAVSLSASFEGIPRKERLKSLELYFVNSTGKAGRPARSLEPSSGFVASRGWTHCGIEKATLSVEVVKKKIKKRSPGKRKQLVPSQSLTFYSRVLHYYSEHCAEAEDITLPVVPLHAVDFSDAQHLVVTSQYGGEDLQQMVANRRFKGKHADELIAQSVEVLEARLGCSNITTHRRNWCLSAGVAHLLDVGGVKFSPLKKKRAKAKARP